MKKKQPTLLDSLRAATREYRRLNGISQRSMGELVGVSQPQIGRFERGIGSLLGKNLSRLEAVLREAGYMS